VRGCCTRRSSVFAGFGFAVLLAVGAAGCRVGGDRSGAIDPGPTVTVTTVTAAEPTAGVALGDPATTTEPTGAAAPAPPTDLDGLDAELATEIDAVLDALDQYDQITATTEGDPAR
jgi:hypothetical protein